MKITALLETLENSVQEITEAAKKLHALPPKTLNWKQDASRWSIFECIEHLNRYARYYLPLIEEALKKMVSSHKAEGEYKTTWAGRKSVQMMHPSNLKKQSTFKRMNPANSFLNRKTLEEFIGHQQKLTGLLQRAATADINKKTIPLEFFKLVKLTTAEGLEFVIVHEQRHIIQAQNALTEFSKTEERVASV